MPQHRRAADPATKPPDPQGSSQFARGGRRPRQRVDITTDSPSARVQRMLVLADRFRAVAVLKADPVRLVDLLRSIITLARETFGSEFPSDRGVRRSTKMRPDQLRCVRDLELLLQDLAYGSPEAWRGLGHAMDGLLIQCLLFEVPKSAAAELTEP